VPFAMADAEPVPRTTAMNITTSADAPRVNTRTALVSLQLASRKHHSATLTRGPAVLFSGVSVTPLTEHGCLPVLVATGRGGLKL